MTQTREDRLPCITAHMAAYIRIRRNELGLSLDQLAERAGSSKSHVWALEQQQSKNPTLWLILALCDALQCSLNSLIGTDVSQPMFSDQEMALIDAHRRIYPAKSPPKLSVMQNVSVPPLQTRAMGTSASTDIVDELREVATIETSLLYSRRSMLKRAASEIETLRQQIGAAREFAKRHPALSLIDLVEFEAFLKVPVATPANVED